MSCGQVQYRAFRPNDVDGAHHCPPPRSRVLLQTDSAEPTVDVQEWVSRRSIIKYVANVAFGVHSTAPKSREDTILALIRALSHIRRDVAGGSVHIQIPDPQLGQVPQETNFKTIAPDSIHPVLIELLATARFFVESPDIYTPTDHIHRSRSAPFSILSVSLPIARIDTGYANEFVSHASRTCVFSRAFSRAKRRSCRL
jgi:hypothetical protein